jgi:hypothetical protein
MSIRACEMGRTPPGSAAFTGESKSDQWLRGGSSPEVNRESRFCHGSLKFIGTFAEVLAYWRRREYFSTAQLLS